MQDLPDLLSMREAAEALHCSTRTLRRRIDGGELRASQVAERGGWVIQRDDLIAFLDARATRPRDRAIAVQAAPPRPTGRRPATRGRLVVTSEMGRRG